MILRAEGPAAERPQQEFEVVHRENAVGSVALYTMFVVNIVGFLVLVAILVDIGGSVRRGQDAAFAFMAQLTLLTGAVTVWAGLAVVCGAVRYFNRRTFLRAATPEL